MGHINSRKYGYTRPEASGRTEIDNGKINSLSSLMIRRKGASRPGLNKFWLILVFILSLPFKIIYWFFMGLGKLWRIRPRLSQKTKSNLRAKLGWIILTLVIFSFLGGTILVAWASRDLPDPEKLTDRKVAQSTKILDRTGEHVLYEVFNDQKRTLVTLDQVPKNLINGVIATEDSKFYEHNGIRPLSWLRAVVYGIFTNKRIRGTSTLTQQLVKNAILTNERSVIRKIKEVILSLRLEQKYRKEQILQIYFNEIPYGSTNYGIESAAQSYFGKHVADLNLQECATLAGLPQAPSKFLNNSEALKDRRDFVLERMFAEGYITRVEADKAQAEPVTLQKNYGDIKAPHFVLYVKEQLVNKYGEQLVDSGGLRVITTLDWDKQQIAEKVVSSSVKNLLESKANNAALVAVDPKTGQILAMVGSRDFNNKEIDGQFNVVVQGKRQPGSSFKPIIYAALFEKGYTPDTILWDVNRNFAISGKPYEPHDYDNKERGPVTIRQALQGSLNLPAVEALYLLGSGQGVQFAERLGYTTLSEGEFGLSLVLGGGEVKLLEHVNAFGVFANNGVKNENVSILKIEDSTGEILYEWKKREGEQVLDNKVAATISNILSDDVARAYIFGASSTLTLKDRPVAVKTGTTNNYRDAWTVGYTPSLVAGVWVGNTNNTEMKKGDGGSRLAAPIWNKFMSEASKVMPVEIFPDLPINDANKPILRGSIGGSITLGIDKVTGKIATSSTPSSYVEIKTFIPAHSILYYVNKDDPRGTAPVDPAVDPQYNNWENAIQDWVKRMKEQDPNWQVSFADPPIEYDASPSVEQLPSVEVISPVPSSTITSRQIITNIKATAPRGVAKVTYKIDEKYVGVVKEPPFNLDYYASGLTDGLHTLYIIVEDDIENRVIKEISFVFLGGQELPSITWSENSLKVNQLAFPKMFYLNFYQLDKIIQANVYKQQESGVKTLVGTIILNNIFNNQLSFRWSEIPEKGVWNLITEVKLKDGSTASASKMIVTVE